MSTNNVVPERIILEVARLGIEAVSTDLAATAVGESILDHILGATLDDTEIVKARALWTTNPPSAVIGFSRIGTTFPLFALTMSSDEVQQDYIGLSEQNLLSDPDEIKIGSMYRRRLRGTFTWWCFAEQPDVLVWWYRVLRRILNVGIPRMIVAGLADPVMSGADMMPDPRYTPDNLFTRRLSITVEYEEDWISGDALWIALNGADQAFVTDADHIRVHHIDQFQIPGGVTPIIDGEEDP